MSNFRETPYYVKALKKPEKPKKTKAELRQQNFLNANVALSILVLIAAGVAIYFAAIATQGVSRLENAQSYTISGAILSQPYAAHLDSSAALIAMTLPNDLASYIGKQYSVYSTTAQPHTITIAGGVHTTTWNGVNTIATFGGAIGDGLTFRVISESRIVIVSVTNVAFS